MCPGIRAGYKGAARRGHRDSGGCRPESTYNEEHAKGQSIFRWGTPPDKIKDEIASAKGQKDHRLLLLTERTHECQFGIPDERGRHPGTYALLGGTVAWKNAGSQWKRQRTRRHRRKSLKREV